MDSKMDELEETPSKATSRPITEEDTPEEDGNTMHVPLEFLQGTKFKAGDELVLKVVSADEEGLEVAYAKAPKSESEGASDANAEIDGMDQGEEY